MAKRILNRRELRADFDASERTTKSEDETDEEEEEEGDDDEEEGDEEEGDEAPADDDEAEADEGDEGDDEDAPKKKKKKPAKVAKVKVAKPRSRSRAAKIIRMRVVWGVFDNSNKCVATYDYPKRDEAEQHAVRLTTGPGKTHFIQPVKEPIEEPKEEKVEEKPVKEKKAK